MTVDLAARSLDTDLTEPAARSLVDSIKVDVADLGERIVTAYLGRAWVALGYIGWDALCEHEFDGARLRIPREQRAEQVQSLRESGLSTRAIGSALGVSKGTVDRDLAGAPLGAPAPTVGQDGKTYPAPVAKVTERTSTSTTYGVNRETGEILPEPSGSDAGLPSLPRRERDPVQEGLEQEIDAFGQSLMRLLRVTEPGGRQVLLDCWPAGQIALSPAVRDRVHPDMFRAIAAGLMALADQWRTAA